MSEKNKSLNLILDGLMRRRTIILGGEISDVSAGEVGKRLLSLQMQSNDTINLLIDSNGGNADAAFRLCDLMYTVITAPVRGIAIGECGSAAIFVMLHCKERLGTPHSRYLIHSSTQSKITVPINQKTSESLEHLFRDLKSIYDLTMKLYLSRLTPAEWNEQKTDEERRKFVENLVTRGDQLFDDWISADDAVRAGVIERVVYDKLDIFSN